MTWDHWDRWLPPRRRVAFSWWSGSCQENSWVYNSVGSDRLHSHTFGGRRLKPYTWSLEQNRMTEHAYTDTILAKCSSLVEAVIKEIKKQLRKHPWRMPCMMAKEEASPGTSLLARWGRHSEIWVLQIRCLSRGRLPRWLEHPKSQDRSSRSHGHRRCKQNGQLWSCRCLLIRPDCSSENQEHWLSSQ